MLWVTTNYEANHLHFTNLIHYISRALKTALINISPSTNGRMTLCTVIHRDKLSVKNHPTLQWYPLCSLTRSWHCLKLLDMLEHLAARYVSPEFGGRQNGGRRRDLLKQILPAVMLPPGYWRIPKARSVWAIISREANMTWNLIHLERRSLYVGPWSDFACWAAVEEQEHKKSKRGFWTNTSSSNC